MPKLMFDLITVGHFAIDLILSPKIASLKPTLGGPPTYVSSAAQKLGVNVAVISKVGDDFPEEYFVWLKKHNIKLVTLKPVKNAKTTKFVLDYTKGWRRLQLKSLAPPILPGDIPISLQAKAVHVAPIANELSKNVLDKLRAVTNTLSLDPQGFVREFDEKGDVHLKNWEHLGVLEQVDVYKSSVSEIKRVTRLNDLALCMRRIQDYGVKVVIVTESVKGSTLLFEGNFCHVAAYKARVIRDLTGAGDTFIGAFLAEYIQNRSPVWCACVGSAAASFVVQGVGPAVFGNKKETYKRAHEIYEKGVKRLTRI
ncbi:MAG: PfkB family carbohydrate kinase [Thermoproteota archaeon]|nr:PfkB family carbohydrate kinase [Thermoproteota archaeon]